MSARLSLAVGRVVTCRRDFQAPGPPNILRRYSVVEYLMFPVDCVDALRCGHVLPVLGRRWIMGVSAEQVFSDYLARSHRAALERIRTKRGAAFFDNLQAENKIQDILTVPAAWQSESVASFALTLTAVAGFPFRYTHSNARARDCQQVAAGCCEGGSGTTRPDGRSGFL
jgi:hypothetical protein